MPIEPNPYDSPERVLARKNQEDPLILYLIVRESLEMSTGKIAAQCGHGVQMVMSKFLSYMLDIDNQMDPVTKRRCQTLKEWLEQSFRKVVLKADNKEWEKIKLDLPCFLVRDAGLTEVAEGSETVIALWPMRKSDVPKLIKRLQVLK